MHIYLLFFWLSTAVYSTLSPVDSDVSSGMAGMGTQNVEYIADKPIKNIYDDIEEFVGGSRNRLLEPMSFQINQSGSRLTQTDTTSDSWDYVSIRNSDQNSRSTLRKMPHLHDRCDPDKVGDVTESSAANGAATEVSKSLRSRKPSFARKQSIPVMELRRVFADSPNFNIDCDIDLGGDGGAVSDMVDRSVAGSDAVDVASIMTSPRYWGIPDSMGRFFTWFIRGFKGSRVVPDRLGTIEGVLDYYSLLVSIPSAAHTAEALEDQVLLKLYMRVIMGWQGVVDVANEWTHVLQGDRLLELAVFVTEDDLDGVGREIVTTAMLVVSELAQRTLNNGGLVNVMALEKILDTNPFMWKICNEKNNLVSRVILDRHNYLWKTRPMRMNHNFEHREWAVLAFAGMAFANRVCPAGLDAPEDLTLRSVFFIQRVQRLIWQEQLLYTGSQKPVLIVLPSDYARDRKAALDISLEHLITEHTNQLRSGIRVNYLVPHTAFRNTPSADHMFRVRWFAHVVEMFTDPGFGGFILSRHNGKIVRLNRNAKDMSPMGHYFGMGRFFALSIVYQIPLGVGLSPNLLKLYLGEPVTELDAENEIDKELYVGVTFEPPERTESANRSRCHSCDSEHMEELFCSLPNCNYVACFIDGFNNILPRQDLLKDQIVSSSEINQLLIGEQFIDPEELVSYFEFNEPISVEGAARNPPVTTDMWRNTLDWFTSVVKSDLTQYQIRRFVHLLSSDPSLIPIGGLHGRIAPVKVTVNLGQVGDQLPLVVRPLARSIRLPVHSSREHTKRKVIELIQDFDEHLAWQNIPRSPSRQSEHQQGAY